VSGAALGMGGDANESANLRFDDHSGEVFPLGEVASRLDFSSRKSLSLT
jgi:hypothetical protein